LQQFLYIRLASVQVGLNDYPTLVTTGVCPLQDFKSFICQRCIFHVNPDEVAIWLAFSKIRKRFLAALFLINVKPSWLSLMDKFDWTRFFQSFPGFPIHPA
jgi:hypothetical protein